MSWEREAFDALRSAGIDVVAYLPDSVVDGVIGLCEDAEEVDAYRVAREEEGVSLLAGAWLAGRRGALVCQSSGLANCFNALGSHNVPAGLPFVGLVTHRGGLGEHNLAQVPAGYGMPRMLEGVGVRTYELGGADEVGACVGMAADTAFSTESPFVLLLEPTLTGGK